MRETQEALAERVASFVRDARIELIPLKGADQLLAAVPRSTAVTITSSPRFGLARTLDLTAAAVAAGHRAIPHLAARQVTDKAELRAFIGRLGDLGVTDLYVIGGDAEIPAGKYTESAEVLDALGDIDHGLTSIGVACYPEGHPKISDDALADALRRKQPYANYMVSQLCFDPEVLRNWLRSVRQEGVTLPLHVGLAAPMSTPRLAQLSVRIGVGQSIRYLTKQHGMIGSLLRGSGYRPEALLTDMGKSLLDPLLAVEGVHVFSFNQTDAVIAWQNSVAAPRRGRGRHGAGHQ